MERKKGKGKKEGMFGLGGQVIWGMGYVGVLFMSVLGTLLLLGFGLFRIFSFLVDDVPLLVEKPFVFYKLRGFFTFAV